MVGDDLFRSELSRLFKGHFFLRPRGFNHSRGVLLAVAEGAVHDISHAVNHPDLKGDVSAQINVGRLLGNKLRLGRHNRLACRRLRKLVNGSAVYALVADIRQDNQVHKPLDKGRFSCADGADHPDIDVAVGTARNILINVSFLHCPAS